MNNIILKSLSVENFNSFADKMDFTTVVDSSKKEFVENTFQYEGVEFNKVSFLYGANGSGKTFFCKILREIQRMLDWSPLTAMNNGQLLSLPQFSGMDKPIPTFAFDTEYSNKPTRFSIDILLEGITYHYEFAVLDKKVIFELLTKKFE